MKEPITCHECVYWIPAEIGGFGQCFNLDCRFKIRSYPFKTLYYAWDYRCVYGKRKEDSKEMSED